MNDLDKQRANQDQSRPKDNVVSMVGRKRKAQTEQAATCPGGVCQIQWKPKRPAA
jgi:hypothetical protein